ncbi:MAG TPA: carboxymuconolactone decarboxylase family protein [Frankiaceae bacterium]|nr:carboxymuconolactone decarboxylase family protein [Frankiaceae bacterium]
MSDPRIAPLPRELWDDDVRGAIGSGLPEGVKARFLSTGADAMRPPNAITTFMHHPALTGPWLNYNAQLLQRPALDPRHRELVVLRVAWRAKAEYEWVQHIRLAKRYGITPEEIEAITRGSSGAEWSALEADLLTATDELLDGFRVSDETWKRLAEHLDVKQMLELLFVVGTYTTLAMAFNSLGVQLDPELDPASGPAIPARNT